MADEKTGGCLGRDHHWFRAGLDSRYLSVARATLKTLVFTGLERGGLPGGQLMLTTEVENSRLPQRHHGTRADGGDARAGPPFRHTTG